MTFLKNFRRLKIYKLEFLPYLETLCCLTPPDALFCVNSRETMTIAEDIWNQKSPFLQSFKDLSSERLLRFYKFLVHFFVNRIIFLRRKFLKNRGGGGWCCQDHWHHNHHLRTKWLPLPAFKGPQWLKKKTRENTGILIWFHETFGQSEKTRRDYCRRLW